MRYLIVLYLLVTVGVGASADALGQEWGHILEAVEILLLISFPIVFKLNLREFLYCLGAYICIRIFAFDYTFNLVAGNDLSYLGGKNWWDMALSRQYPGGLLFGRLIFFIVGLAFVFKNVEKYVN